MKGSYVSKNKFDEESINDRINSKYKLTIDIK